MTTAAQLLAEFGDDVAEAGNPLFIAIDLIGDTFHSTQPFTAELNPFIQKAAVVATARYINLKTGEPIGNLRLACVVDRTGEVDYVAVSPDRPTLQQEVPVAGVMLNVLRLAMGVVG